MRVEGHSGFLHQAFANNSQVDLQNEICKALPTARIQNGESFYQTQ